jgi:spermidine synthase
VTTSRARVRRRAPLELLVLAVGFSSLGAEIAAARLMAPFFGASTVIWANTIAVVLVALAAGYRLGGRLADRRPSARALAVLVLLASVLLAAVPLVAHPFLSLSVRAFDTLSVGAFFSSLFGVLVLVAVPVLLLGAVSPWAVRLRLRDVAAAGATAGRLYAVSTAGSLAGTWLAALVLIPQLGTQRTFLVLAAVPAAVAALQLGGRWPAVPVALVAALALPVGTVKPAETGRVLYETETPYQYARVVQMPDGSRRLELNEGQAIHSLWRPRTVLTNNYWDGFLVLPFATGTTYPPQRIAILGTAGGTVARAYAAFYPSTEIDAVDIDGALFAIGRRYFGLRERPQLHEYAQDARPFLRRTHARYDAIFVDAYRQPYIPFYLATREFFALVRAHLRPHGTVIVNVGHPSDSSALETALSATMRAVFPHVARDPIETSNTLLMASADRLDGTLVQAAPVPGPLRPLAWAQGKQLGPARRGGSVFTDDKAPVEWLIDTSIVRYAAGESK